MRKPTKAAIDAWVRLVRAYRAAIGGIEAALKAEDLPPLSWYDALLELRRAPEGLRLFELEERMLLPQYNASRLVDRLDAAGYLMKATDPKDARGRVLTLTSAGNDLLERMWPVYARALQVHIGARLSSEEARQLAELLTRIACRPDQPRN